MVKEAHLGIAKHVFGRFPFAYQLVLFLRCCMGKYQQVTLDEGKYPLANVKLRAPETFLAVNIIPMVNLSLDHPDVLCFHAPNLQHFLPRKIATITAKLAKKIYTG